MVFGSIQLILLFVLTLAALVVQLWAFGDCLIRPAAAFLAAGKRTKGVWLLITGGSAIVGLLSMPPLRLFASGFGTIILMAAVVASCVYLADVRPAVRGHRRPRRGPSGPRGGW